MTEIASDLSEPRRCPFCGWPAMAMMDNRTKVWRVYCNDDGTCGDDAPGCCAEGPEAKTEAKAVAAWNKRAELERLTADIARLGEALRKLSFAAQASVRTEGYDKGLCEAIAEADAALQESGQ